MAIEPSFSVTASSGLDPGSTLLVGLPQLGMAGLTATNYLVDHHESEEIGHVSTRGYPAIAPFEDGVPRHHTRLYSIPDCDLSVVVGELLVAANAAESFVEGLRDWVDGRRIDEIVVLHGIPYPHGPDEHDVFSVATPGYRADRLDESGIDPLKGGVLDGVAGELITRGLDDQSLESGVFVTPSHPPGPDIDASLRLLDAVERVYPIEIDERELERLREQLRQYYAELSDRFQSLAERDQTGGRYDYPEDRAFM